MPTVSTSYVIINDTESDITKIQNYLSQMDYILCEANEVMVVLNIILAKLNLDKGPIDITAKYSIKEALLNYEKFKTKLRLCYSAEDNQIIDDIVAEINSKRDIWKM